MLELGSGCGVAGVAAACAGAACVTLTDCVPQVLDLLRRTVHANVYPSTSASRDFSGVPLRSHAAAAAAEETGGDKLGDGIGGGERVHHGACCALAPAVAAREQQHEDGEHGEAEPETCGSSADDASDADGARQGPPATAVGGAAKWNQAGELAWSVVR